MKKAFSIVLSFCLAAGMLTGCGNTASSSSSSAAVDTASEAQSGGTEATGEPVLIGVSNMVTGPMAAGGLRMKQTITMAFEEINANGGVLGGRPLQMVLVDDTGTPTGAVNSVNRILGDNITACIGPQPTAEDQGMGA